MNQEIRNFFDKHAGAPPIYYRPRSAPRQILRESLLPYLPIVGFDMPVAEMYEEAKKLIPMMVSHRSEYEDNKGWKSLVLHGLGALKTEGAERYNLNPEDKSIYDWTEIASLAPVTTEFFRDHFKYDFYQRIRFMLLEPGGYVCPHTDFDQYVLGPVNIALNNPIGCDFVMEDKGTLPFQQGTIMKLALVNRHAVFNSSNENRIHMIIHGGPNDQHWGPILQESYRQLVQQERFQALPEENIEQVI
jgi:hypothetical protein